MDVASHGPGSFPHPLALETVEHAEGVAEHGARRLTIPSLDWAGAATWLLSVLLVVYLCLENGGYDPIPRGQVGFLAWWLLLLGVAVQALPLPGRDRAGLVALGLLLGFALWTALSLEWTQSQERTATELTRVVTYLGVFALGTCLATRRQAGARQVLGGVTFALGLVAALAVLSRFHMAWFPANELGKVLPGIEIERRLAYPLNYSSAMGALAGMALPLLLAATGWARTIAVRALAAAAIPLAGLVLYLATSGTGAAVAIVAMAAFLALSPDRLPKLLTLAAGTGGGALLALGVHGREALARGLPTPAAEQQGTEMIWIAIGVCGAVALAQVAIALVARGLGNPGLLYISRRQALVATAAVAVVAIPIAIGAGAPHEASHRWEVFKSRGGSSAGPSSPSSILSFHGSGRYQFWQSAVEASETEPVKGIGPGTFEFWWARHASYPGYVRTAHSLYLENLAELGIPGLLLIVGFVFAVLGIGATRAMRAPPDERLLLAAATAGAAGFAMAAALDWVWQIAALSAAFMLLAAVAVSGYSLPDPTRRRRRSRRKNQNRLKRVGVVTGCAVALLVIWFPLRGATHLRQSQVDAAHGDLPAALGEAEAAADAQSYAASPLVQEAVILEQQGKLRPAAAAAADATRKEAAEWRTWFILARIEAERGRVAPALRAYAKAHERNPIYHLLKG